MVFRLKQSMVTSLWDQLKELDASCGACNRCGMCQSVCPVFKATGLEGDVARGKIALLDGLSRKLITRPDQVLARLNRCLLCGACERSCSRQVDLIRIFLTARSIVTRYTGLSRMEKVVLRWIVTNPDLFDRLMRIVYRLQWLFLKKDPERDDLVKVRAGIPRLGGRYVTPLPERSFRFERSADVQNTAEGPVAVFFAGCLIDKVMPEVAEACLKVLRRAGVNVRLIDREACCGIPALSAGDSETFETLVGENLTRIFTGRCDVVLTACATCTMTLRDLWPEMTTHPGNREKARDLSKRVMDIGEYVLSSTALGKDPRFFKQDKGRIHRVTWHDPCHLKGVTKTGTLARQFLKGLPGYTFSEMRDAGVCCGSGGSFGLAHQDLSAAIGHRKVQRIEESGAEMVTTACPACVIQIRDMMARKGSNVRIRHFMEIVADALDDSGSE